MQINGYPLSHDGTSSVIKAALSRYGTPLFVYAGSIFNRQWNLLRQTFPAEFAISYSVKANPNPAIIRYFLDKGSGIEVASAGEFFLASKAGSAPENILFAGPGKTDQELEYVLARGIGEIHAESAREVERISCIAGKLGVRARVALRINPNQEAQGGAMQMGGKCAPFGIDEERFPIVMDRVIADSNLKFSGIHLFSGTQILDHAVLMRQYRKGIELAKKAARKLGRPLETLDFGGGLGIPYFANEKPLNTNALQSELASLMAEVRDETLLLGTRFVIEPGRFLVGEAGMYVARITEKKVSRGKTYLVLDGGMNHHLAASGNLGQVIKKNFPLAILSKPDQEPVEKVDVVGPLCTPLDVLARDVILPSTDVGDYVGILQSGAYARAASPLNFLSHPAPAEVLIEDDEVRLIRRRGTLEDLVADLP